MRTQAGALKIFSYLIHGESVCDARRGPQPKKLNTESWVKGRQAVGTKHVKETPPDLRLDELSC